MSFLFFQLCIVWSYFICPRFKIGMLSICEQNNREWLAYYNDDSDPEKFDELVRNLVSPREDATYTEIYCLSILYQIDVIVYEEIRFDTIRILTTIRRNSPTDTIKMT